MVNLLDVIRRRTPAENEYLGDRPLIDAQIELSMKESQNDDEGRLRALSKIGVHELRLGKNKQAVEHLQQAYELLPSVSDHVSKTFSESVVFGLSVAYLRLGETENCIHCQTGESCILPIRGEGIHQHPSGSRNAIKFFQEVLETNPDHLASRWLLNIAYMTIGEYPNRVPPKYLIPAETFSSEEGFPRFDNIAAGAGVDTFSLSGGTAAEDFDGDKFIDLVVSDWSTSGQIRFLRNKGDGGFEDLTESAGLTGLFGGLNLVHADYDNDGDFDVLVLRGAWLGEAGRYPNSLLQNDGQGHFQDVTFESGLGDEHFPTITAAWADYDNDGDLDLFIGNEGFPCQLFQNNGQGRFRDVAETAGVTNGRISKGAAWGDYNADGWPDLYVSNIDQKNRLYKNQGNGRFLDVAAEAGVELPLRSFPVWFWDYNNDGLLDIWVGSYEAAAREVAAGYLGLPHNSSLDCFYRGSVDGVFTDATQELGFTRVTRPMGCNFGDVDNDGFLDFYLGTGDPYYENLMPNLFFHNQQGRCFSDVTFAAGLGHLQKGHGVAFADFDHDGDQDIFIEMGGAYPGDGFRNALFENPGFGHHGIKLRLIGTKSNRCAIGARIHLTIDDGTGERSIYRWIDNGSSFGGNPFRQEIGVGQATMIKSINIDWPTSGETQVFNDIDVDQFLEITEGIKDYRVVPLKQFEFHRPPAGGAKKEIR
ncbi:MAG: FG-GAP-like repeat-containing protein [Planctomycetota bacterium]|nr:FG-GAP-like repeat-containing protein [Planctomycetota bacterium]MDA1211130.1 FG-GAP-like repeat-containing protein [Planctomycetota bacterium]